MIDYYSFSVYFILYKINYNKGGEDIAIRITIVLCAYFGCGEQCLFYLVDDSIL
jgi:hypothetical protein